MNNLSNFLNDINNNIPYYSNMLQNTPLGDYPIITKQIIRNNYDKFISQSLGEKKKRVIEILEGDFIPHGESINEVYEFDNFIFEETTGTSGIPFRVVKSKEDRIHIGASVWKARRCIDKQVKINNLYRLNHIGISEKNMNPYNYEVDHIVELYRMIDENKYRWLHISPNPLLQHIKIIKENDIKIRMDSLKYIECTGNYYNDDERALIEETFQVKTVNQYGSIETWPLAYEYLDNKMHVLDNVIIEILDDQNYPVKEYNTPGNIVITCLGLKTMPFIRYKIGDYGEYINEENSNELNTNVIKLLPGRDVNILKGVDQKVFGNIFFSKIVQAVVRNMDLWDEIRYIQIWQMNEKSFTIFINEFEGANIFVKNIEEITIKELNKDVIFSCEFLNNDEIRKRQLEKPNVFLCKY